MLASSQMATKAANLFGPEAQFRGGPADGLPIALPRDLHGQVLGSYMALNIGGEHHVYSLVLQGPDLLFVYRGKQLQSPRVSGSIA
ncbi:MAG: hypothetical protein M3Q17_07940 [Actinomycetota bacterium]|nr:hypothetical protein [Actinomycetota bacterium]